MTRSSTHKKRSFKHPRLWRKVLAVSFMSGLASELFNSISSRSQTAEDAEGGRQTQERRAVGSEAVAYATSERPLSAIEEYKTGQR
jgi:hypothetical protein